MDGDATPSDGRAVPYPLVGAAPTGVLSLTKRSPDAVAVGATHCGRPLGGPKAFRARRGRPQEAPLRASGLLGRLPRLEADQPRALGADADRVEGDAHLRLEEADVRAGLAREVVELA